MPAFVFLFLFFTACENKKEIIIKIKAHDDAGEALSETSVFIDDEEEGITDSHGFFLLKKEIPVSSVLQLRLEKTSKDFYFASHLEKIIITDDGISEYSVKGLLYKVPKTLPREHLVEPKTPQTTEATESSKKEKAEEQKTSDIQKQNLDVKENVFTVLIKDKTANPIPGAMVYFFKSKEADENLACTANQRGRCVIRIIEAKDAPQKIIVKAKGFANKSSTVYLKDKGVLKVFLVPSGTIEITTSLRHFGQTSPLSSVEVFIDGMIVGQTDTSGLLRYNFPKEKKEAFLVELKAKNYAPDSYKASYLAADELFLNRTFISKTKTIPRLKLLPPTDETASKQAQFLFRDEFERQGGLILETLEASELNQTTEQTTVLPFGLLINTFSRGKELSIEAKLVTDVAKNPEVLYSVRSAYMDTLTTMAAKAWIKGIAKQIIRFIPREALILSYQEDSLELTVNLGKKEAPWLNTPLYGKAIGMLVSEKGDKKTSEIVGHLSLLEAFKDKSIFKMSDKKQRSQLEKGDFITIGMETPQALN